MQKPHSRWERDSPEVLAALEEAAELELAFDEGFLAELAFEAPDSSQLFVQ
jgi:hypothetical protein